MKKKNKAIALALALWVSLVIFVVGATFLGLSINQSHSMEDQVLATQALELANSGLQFVVNYMSCPNHWEEAGGVEVLVKQQLEWSGTRVNVDRQDLKAIVTPTEQLAASGDLSGTWQVEVNPVMSNGVGQLYSYSLKVTATLQRAGETAARAGRQVTARIREVTPLDYAMFIQNYRAWDAPGMNAPSNNLGTDDCVGFNDGFSVKGWVRADGASAGDPAANTAGNFNVWGNNDVHFYGTASIQKAKNTYSTTDESSINAMEKKIFPRGLTKGEASYGLPNSGDYLTLNAGQPGIAQTLAQTGYSGPGTPPWLITIADSDITYDPANPLVPNIPSVKITLSGTQMYVEKMTRNSLGQFQSMGGQWLSVSDLPNRMLYVQGGNVQVQGSLSGQELTIVADDNASRGIYDPSLSLPEKRGNQWYWPAPTPNIQREGNVSVIGDVTYPPNNPSALGILAKNYVFLNDYTFNTGSTDGKTMEINAALMSYAHSVQFDWDNFSRNTLGNSGANLNDPAFRATFKNMYKNGILKYRGSIIGKFADVEADTYGRGYTNQQMGHDSNYTNMQPPNFPHWSKVAGKRTTPVNYIVLAYEDLGSQQVNH